MSRPWSAIVLVVSTSAANGTAKDSTGNVLVTWLRGIGLEVGLPIVISDGQAVGASIVWAAERADLIVTTGGTGVSPTDRTPDFTQPLLDSVIPGIPEMLRARGVAEGIPTAVLSRGVAGVIGSTLVINLPGSSQAVADACEALSDVIGHALAQVAGGSQARRGHQPRVGMEPGDDAVVVALPRPTDDDGGTA